jgi:hypothetical protein
LPNWLSSHGRLCPVASLFYPRLPMVSAFTAFMLFRRAVLASCVENLLNDCHEALSTPIVTQEHNPTRRALSLHKCNDSVRRHLLKHLLIFP